MLNSLFPFVYGIAVIYLLWQAFRVMSRGFFAEQPPRASSNMQNNCSKADRTGQITVHPELLDNDGRITNEELLTVRFSEDVDSDPPKSAEKSAE